MLKIKFFLSITFFLALFFPYITEAQSGLCLSQVQITGGEGKTKEDFIELYNGSSDPVNLKGYRLVKRTTASTSTDTLIKSWTADTLVLPGTFYLWANVDYLSIPLSPDATTTLTISDDNGVALRNGANDTGEIIDSISWGEAQNSFTKVFSQNPSGRQSLQRSNCQASFSIALSSPKNSSSVPVGTGFKLESVIAINSNNHTTPNNLNDASGSITVGLAKTFDIKITEILPNPEGEDEGKEQIEIENTGSLPVNLDGYFLQDKTESGPKTNAFRIDGLILPAKTVFSFVLPKGKFVLNNTKGDELNLFFPDTTLADKVVYLEDAKEGWSWQKIDNNWVWQKPSIGKKNFLENMSDALKTFVALASTTPINATSSFYTLHSFVNEIFANPKGADEGNEWVEFYNPSENTENLKGFILDDAGEGAPSSNSLVLPDLQIASKTYVVFKIPEDKFALNNSGKEEIRLFSTDKKLLKTISFEDAKEGESYYFLNGEWKFGPPTPWKNNEYKLPELPPIKFWEILPSPGPDEDEFIELKNLSSEVVSLTGFIIKAGKREYDLEEGLALFSKGLLAISTEDINLKLNNSGQKLELYDPYGRLVDSVTYPKAKKNLAWAYVNNGFVWTSNLTPGEENVYSRVEVSANKIETANGLLKSANSDNQKEQGEKIIKDPENNQAQTELMSKVVLGLATGTATTSLNAVSAGKGSRHYKWLVFSGLSLVGLGFGLWKLKLFG